MYRPNLFTTTTLPLPRLINGSRCSLGFLLVALAWSALSLTARAQDGSVGDGTSTAEGSGALSSLTTGADNTAVGFVALESNTTGNDNTAVGTQALSKNTTGNGNTANGYLALLNDTTGSENTATGVTALASNTTGIENTATGVSALSGNTTGSANTATGFEALFRNTTGFQLVANGFDALFNNTTGANNTATGFSALFSNTTGNNNTADGLQALVGNTSGAQNTATGVNALAFNKIGNNNTANGFFALQLNTGSGNTACGESALANNKGGSNNIALGTNAGVNLTTGSNDIDIGNKGVAGESNTIRIGTVGTQKATFIAGIHGVPVANTLQVVVDVNGHLGTVGSSERFKEAIKPMDKASEGILSLQPVTFQYKHDIDPDKVPQFGLIAEEVEKVNPDLVVRDEEGKAYTVRYEAVNAMLLNEFLKAHRKVEGLEEIVTQQQKQIEALTATVQKVSEQVALSKTAPQLVANP
jgi:trimeric autotransporter adhesin